MGLFRRVSRIGQTTDPDFMIYNGGPQLIKPTVHTQTPIYFPTFTNNVRSYLLRSPVIDLSEQFYFIKKTINIFMICSILTHVVGWAGGSVGEWEPNDMRDLYVTHAS